MGGGTGNQRVELLEGRGGGERGGGGGRSRYGVSAKGKKNTKNANFFFWWCRSIRGFSLFAEGLGTKSRRKAKDDCNVTDKESIAK